MNPVFTTELKLKNVFTQFSRQARNEYARSHFELVEKVG